MYGTKTSNGTWNGMIGMIVNEVRVFIWLVKDALNRLLFKEVDVGVQGFSVTNERSLVVDFTVPFVEDPSVILIAASTAKNRFFVFFKPFQMTVIISVSDKFHFRRNAIQFRVLMFVWGVSMFVTGPAITPNYHMELPTNPAKDPTGTSNIHSAIEAVLLTRLRYHSCSK